MWSVVQKPVIEFVAVVENAVEWQAGQRVSATILIIEHGCVFNYIRLEVGMAGWGMLNLD